MLEHLEKLSGQDRIIFLANLLMSEIQRQGYQTAVSLNLNHISISHYIDLQQMYPGEPDLRIFSSISSWYILGFRKD